MLFPWLLVYQEPVVLGACDDFCGIPFFLGASALHGLERVQGVRNANSSVRIDLLFSIKLSQNVFFYPIRSDIRTGTKTIPLFLMYTTTNFSTRTNFSDYSKYEH